MSASIQQLVQDASDGANRARQTRAAARLMTLLEAQPHRLPDVFRHLPQDAWPRPRLVLGITGAPGSGKSTLVDALIFEYRRRHPDSRIGAVAVDPSSPFTGGAVLGDRVRMMRHAEDPKVFIRSLASRGHLGGLSLGVRGVLRVMGLIGCDLVLIETVGVGQSEVEIAGVADLVLIALAPGQGDAVQMLKAGLLEIGDIFAVNKADTPGADRLKSTLLNTLSLGFGLESEENECAGDAPSAAQRPDVLLISATEQTGIDELVDILERRTSEQSTRWQSHRDEKVLDEVRDAIQEEVRLRIGRMLGSGAASSDDLQRVLAGDVSVSDLTSELLQRATGSTSEATTGSPAGQ